MGVETAMMAGGMAASAASTVGSFIQASAQRAMQNKAQQDAEKAMADAERMLSINYAKQLAVKKEPYELQREAGLVQGAEAIQAGVESERGAAATAGKIQMAQNELQSGIRSEMGKEMTDIDKAVVDEESRLRDLRTQLKLGEAQGAQQAAADAQRAAAAATAQGFQGVTSLGQQAIQMIPLFGKGGLSAEDKAMKNFSKSAAEHKVSKIPTLAPTVLEKLPPATLKPMNINVGENENYKGYDVFDYLNNPFINKKF